jgi:hypothetical protein
MDLTTILEDLNNSTHKKNQNNTTQTNKMKIHFVDGLCGSGKTHGLGKYIQQFRFQKFIITTPSIALAVQIYNQFESLRIGQLHAIYTKSDVITSINIPAEIMAKIDQINKIGHGVIICTQQAFPRLDFFENKQDWTLIIDEIPTIDKFDSPSLPYNHHHVSKYIELGEEVGNSKGLYEIRANGLIMPSNHDAVNAFFKNIVEDINDPNYHCYTDKANWDKLVIRNQVTTDTLHDAAFGNNQNKMYFLRLLQPTIYQGFKQVIIMGANFEQSLLHHYWSIFCGVDFIPFHEITANLRYTKYDNGERLTIHYLQEENWSKHSAGKLVNGKTKLDHFAKLVEKFMGDQEFIYMTNNDDSREFTSGKKAPVISHGINEFDVIDNIYFSPALNNQPKHNQMLFELGLDDAFIKRAMFHEVAHQAIMRTSLRRPDCQKPVTAIVSDKATAEAIARQFTGCHIGAIDGCIRKVIGLSNTEHKSKSRLQKLIELHDLNSLVMHRQSASLDLNNPNVNAPNNFSSTATSEKLSKNPIYIGINGQNILNKPDFLDLSLGVTYMSDIYQKSVTGIKENAPMAFVKTMQGIHTNHIISAKDESFLFNGVTYKTEESRTMSNVDFASIVVIDIDDGDLSPEVFRDIFTNKTKHSFFMCNSFSRSTEKPNNFRAVFFINQVVNDEIYRDIHLYLQNIIAKYGYITCSKQERNKLQFQNSELKFSGIDLTKTHTASFFYLPCKVQSRLDQAFFWRGNLKDNHQLKCYAIDVTKVIQNTPIATRLSTLIYETPVKHNAQKATNGCEIDITNLAAIKEFIKQGNFKHLGNHIIYGKMARAMNDAGFLESDFIELTPFISESKTAEDAKKFWEKWKDYTQITKGTLFYYLGLTRSKA